MVDGPEGRIGMDSRRKGKVGEREFAALLREHGFDARRGVQYSGGVDSPDVVIFGGSVHGHGTAGVLPNLPLVIPVKAELGQAGGGGRGLLLGELNPDPLADNLREVVEVGSLGAEQGEQVLRGQVPIRGTLLPVDGWAVGSHRSGG
jgi:hypothetical protein